MFGFFDVNNIAITLLDYPMSFVELIGTIFYVWSVWLIARRNIWTWPIGIVSVILYMLLFYQLALYSDTVEQIYYLVTSFYGWWFWRKYAAPQTDGEKTPADVYYSSKRVIAISIVVIVVFTLLANAFFSQAHLILPAIFPTPAAYPFLDALTTVMSFTAMWLMSQKRAESWIYWVIVDVFQIYLYHLLGIRLVELLYVVLLGMAIYGLYTWHTAAIKRKRTGEGTA